MQAYSDPKRESDPHALPDVEVWCDKITVVKCTCGDYEVPYDTAHAESDSYCPSCERPVVEVEDTEREGWWWWTCFPGCLPDSEAHGPFETGEAALADARDGVGDDDDDDDAEAE